MHEILYFSGSLSDGNSPIAAPADGSVLRSRALLGCSFLLEMNKAARQQARFGSVTGDNHSHSPNSPSPHPLLKPSFYS